MSWSDKQAEVLARLKADVEEVDCAWLHRHVDLDCPELETWDSAKIRERFPYRGHLNTSRVTRTYIWQCWLKVLAGEMDPIGGNIRSFWYQHLEDFFRGHGFFDPDPAQQPPPAQPYIETNPSQLDASPEDEDDVSRFVDITRGGSSPEDALIETMTGLMGDFVEHHIFRFGDEFQFQRPIGCKTLVGRDRKKLLFFTEKEGLWGGLCEPLHKAKDKHSISVMASNGEPSLLTLEYFAEDLRSNEVSELKIGAMCDYDPWGFWIAWNLDHKLSSFKRRGVKDAKGHLVPYFKSVTTYLLTTQDLFTPANIKAGRDLSGFRDQTLIQNWLSVTGGVKGKPIGLHVDKVSPFLKRQRVDNWIADILNDGAIPFPKVPKKPDGQARGDPCLSAPSRSRTLSASSSTTWRPLKSSP